MFTGREYDPETGLYYYRARMYSSKIGRFLQTDPIGYYDSMNLYQYCHNNPLNYKDPFGLCEKSLLEKIKELLETLAKLGIYVKLESITLPEGASIFGIDLGGYTIYPNGDYGKGGNIEGNVYGDGEHANTEWSNMPPDMQPSGPSVPFGINFGGMNIQGIAFTATHTDTDMSKGNQGNFPGGQSGGPR